MQLTSKEMRQILLMSLILLIVPMVTFPKKLGLDLAEFSLVNLAVELVYYSIISFFFNRQTTLLKLISAGAVCLGFRLALGAIFGLLIIAMYSIKFSVALSFGLFSYLPAVLLQIAPMPFVLYPAITHLLKIERARAQRSLPGQEPSKPVSRDSSNLVFTKEKPAASRSDSFRKQPDRMNVSYKKITDAPKTATEQSNGFDKAVRYIGENGSVLLAAVIDREGLLLGGFKRCEMAIEDVSPFALLLQEKSQPTLGRAGFGQPERAVYFFDEQKMVVAYEPFYSLVVIAERTVDDVVNIRINQALEMIKTYIAERYSEKLIANAEKIYV